MIRVVIDTNVLISFLFFSEKSQIEEIYSAWKDKLFDAAISLEILKELVDVLSQAKIQDRASIDIATIQTLLKDLVNRSILFKPKYKLSNVLADQDDEKFIELALTADAPYIVSGDKVFLNFGEYCRSDGQVVKIISVSEFVAILRNMKSAASS